MARHHYRGDPHWITARYPGTCAMPDCDQTIARGDRAFYYPSNRGPYAVPCGHADSHERDFESCAHDEEMGGGW